MNPYNPYAPPQGSAADPYRDLVGVDASTDAGAVPDAIVEPLRKTRPWVIFLAVIGFLGTGLMCLMGLVMFAAGRFAQLPPAVGLVYIGLGVVYVPPSVGLLRYGSAIGRLMRDPRMERLKVALDLQRSFWKLVGIMTAVVLALYPIGIVVTIAYFALQAAGAKH